MGTLNFRIDLDESRPAASVWKERTHLKDVWVTRSIEVMQRKCDLGIRIAARSLIVLTKYARRNVEVDAEGYPGGFPVVEQPLLTAQGGVWVAYIAMAENKTLLADVVEFPSGRATRTEARKLCAGRAAKWISGCERHALHGAPILVDQYGRPL